MGAKRANYDLMEVVVINLGDANEETDSDILNLLNTLFSDTTPTEEKKRKLSEDFNIAMTAELESEVHGMCNLGDGIYNKGVGVGEDKLAELINRLIADNKQEDIPKVTTDENIRQEMYKKYGIK